MSERTLVEVVRPKLSASEAVSSFIGRVGFVFLAAWLLMLMIPVVVEWHPGYWQTLVAYLGARCVVAGDTTYLRWTRSSTKK